MQTKLKKKRPDFNRNHILATDPSQDEWTDLSSSFVSSGSAQAVNPVQ